MQQKQLCVAALLIGLNNAAYCLHHACIYTHLAKAAHAQANQQAHPFITMPCAESDAASAHPQCSLHACCFAQTLQHKLAPPNRALHVLCSPALIWAGRTAFYEKWLPAPCSCAHTALLPGLSPGCSLPLPGRCQLLERGALCARAPPRRLRSARGGHRRRAVVRARARGCATVARCAVLPARPPRCLISTRTLEAQWA